MISLSDWQKEFKVGKLAVYGSVISAFVLAVFDNVASLERVFPWLVYALGLFTILLGFNELKDRDPKPGNSECMGLSKNLALLFIVPFTLTSVLANSVFLFLNDQLSLSGLGLVGVFITLVMLLVGILIGAFVNFLLVWGCLFIGMLIGGGKK